MGQTTSNLPRALKAAASAADYPIDQRTPPAEPKGNVMTFPNDAATAYESSLAHWKACFDSPGARCATPTGPLVPNITASVDQYMLNEKPVRNHTTADWYESGTTPDAASLLDEAGIDPPTVRRLISEAQSWGLPVTDNHPDLGGNTAYAAQVIWHHQREQQGLDARTRVAVLKAGFDPNWLTNIVDGTGFADLDGWTPGKPLTDAMCDGWALLAALTA